MTTLTVKHFDLLDFVKKSKEFGVDERVAELQGRQIEQAIDIAVTTAKEEIESKELATKKDIRESELKLELKISETKNQIILWVVGMMTANSLFFLGVMAKGFHWW